MSKEYLRINQIEVKYDNRFSMMKFMKFVADRMLGRLSRWLRLFGYDTLEIMKQENEDNVLLDLAEKEDRILISRDSLLIRKAIRKGMRAYIIQSSEIMEQLQEMRSEFQLNLEPKMDRCTLCNSIIRKIEPFETEILKTKEYVYLEHIEKGKEFWMCDKCGQVYWKGAHWKNIIERTNILKNDNTRNVKGRNNLYENVI